MHFWFQFFCLTWIVGYGITTSSESEFTVMALGPTKLLIYWDPYNFEDTLTNETFDWSFSFNCSIKEEGNETVDSFREVWGWISNGQTLIPDLLVNTTYQITITKVYETKNANVDSFKAAGSWGENYNPERISADRYFVEVTTNLGTNSPPARPEFSIIGPIRLRMTIKWFPCGRKRNCQGLEPGTHFYITYKDLESRNKFKINITKQDNVNIFLLLPGKTYEIFVTSVNGNYETDSVPQEISISPYTSPVQSVEVHFIKRENNESVFISWKPPRQTVRTILAYSICYYPTMPHKIKWTEGEWNYWDNYVIQSRYILAENLDKYQLEVEVEGIQHTSNTSSHNLQRTTNYKFFIIPFVDNDLEVPGFVYELEYTVP